MRCKRRFANCGSRAWRKRSTCGCKKRPATTSAHAEFLELILQDELLVRDERQINRRVKAGRVPRTETARRIRLVAFNPGHPQESRSSTWPPAASSARTGTCCSSDRPGTGKSFLAQAVGYQAIKQGFARAVSLDLRCGPRLLCTTRRSARTTRCWPGISSPIWLIIDDMGMKQLPRRSGEVLFEIIMRRYETRSTMMTSNRPLEDWGKLIGDVPSATAILDRFLHHAEVLTFTGKSYRLRKQTDTCHRRAGKLQPPRRPAAEAGGRAKLRSRPTKKSDQSAPPRLANRNDSEDHSPIPRLVSSADEWRTFARRMTTSTR